MLILIMMTPAKRYIADSWSAREPRRRLPRDVERSRLIQIGRTMDDAARDGALLAAVHTSLEPDAYGQAALLLAESILHALVEAKTLTTDDAISVIETACEVKVEVADQSGESRGRMQESLALLQAISASMSADAS